MSRCLAPSSDAFDHLALNTWNSIDSDAALRFSVRLISEK